MLSTNPTRVTPNALANVSRNEPCDKVGNRKTGRLDGTRPTSGIPAALRGASLGTLRAVFHDAEIMMNKATTCIGNTFGVARQKQHREPHDEAHTQSGAGMRVVYRLSGNSTSSTNAMADVRIVGQCAWKMKRFRSTPSVCCIPIYTKCRPSANLGKSHSYVIDVFVDDLARRYGGTEDIFGDRKHRKDGRCGGKARKNWARCKAHNEALRIQGIRRQSPYRAVRFRTSRAASPCLIPPV
jgi:hypothetical protein